MNVFYLDHDPELAAQMQCDKHVVKMIVESAQLLSTAWHHLLDDEDPRLGLIVYKQELKVVEEHESVGSCQTLHGLPIYRATHRMHPSAEWCRASGGNYRWLWRHAISLCDEYAHRYGRQHRTLPVLWALEVPPEVIADDDEQTQPPPAMDPGYAVLDDSGEYYDSVLSYRNYYTHAKAALLRYTRRAPPDWLDIPFNHEGHIYTSTTYAHLAQ